jgi:hypothetical protein
MAIGAITSLALDTENITDYYGFGGGTMCRVIGNYWVLVYSNNAAGHQITVSTFFIDPDTGAITAVDKIAAFLSTAYDFVWLRACQISEGVFAVGILEGVAVRGVWLFTIGVSALGIINPVPLSSLEFDPTAYDIGSIPEEGSLFHAHGDIYLGLYRRGATISSVIHTYDRLVSFEIPQDGSSITLLDDSGNLNDLSDTVGTNQRDAIHRIYGNIFLVGASTILTSWSVDEVGILTLIDTSALGLSPVGGLNPIRLSNGIWVTTYYTPSSTKKATFTVTDAGDISAAAIEATGAGSGSYNSIKKIGSVGTDCYIVVQWYDSAWDRNVTTYKITALGIATQVATREFMSDWGFTPQIYHLKDNYYVSGGYSANTFKIQTYEIESSAVTITSCTPDSGSPSDVIEVVIAGTNLDLIDDLSFGAGITVDWFRYDSSLQITAQITIAADADYGFRDITGFYLSASSVLEDGFEVTTSDGIYIWLDSEADANFIENPTLTDNQFVLQCRVERGKDDELGEVTTGVLDLTCNNKDGDFSPQNVAGDFYGILDLGVKIYVYEIFDGVTYPIFKGKIESIIPSDDPDDPVAYITAYDGMDDLEGDEIEASKLIDTDDAEAIDEILTEFGWPDGEITIDDPVDSYGIWWVHEQSPSGAIRDVIDNSRGIFYIGRTGYAIYENRHHRLKGTHLTSQYDFGENMLKIDYALTKNFIKNRAKVTGHQYAQSSEHQQPMWSVHTGDTSAPWIPPNNGVSDGELIIWAKMEEPIESLDIPYLVKDTHWSINTAPDGSGDDIGADVSIDIDVYGQAVKMTFTNTNVSTGGYLIHPASPPAWAVSLTDQTLFIAGYAFIDYPFTTEKLDQTSIDDRGKRSLSIDCKFKGNANDIVSYAEWIVANFKDPYPNPVGILIDANQSDAIHAQVLTLEISDRITVASTRLGIDQDFYINKVIHEYELKEGGKVHTVQYKLESTETTGGGGGDHFWLLGEVGYSEIGETTWLGF